MEKKIFFEDARKNVLEMFSIEFPKLPISHVDMMIGMFYNLVNYEEEGKKIRPTIIITSNINAIIKNVPNSKKITFYEDADNSNFKARIKALTCFCIRGWNIYINYGEENIEYGIIKTLTSIKEKSLLQIISQESVLENISKRTNLVIINVQGGGICKLIGGKGNRCSVCFNLNSQTEYNWENEIYEFVEACVSKIKTTKKKLEDIKNLIANIFHKALRDIHGTICMVVDKEYKDKTGFLQDGTWLKEPIEFGKMFVRSSKFDESVLRDYADVLTTMLDFDGITVIDNAGRIRAYNVFIESSLNAQRKVVGGARRRAAYTILENKSKKIIGVYFQSQDGDNFYKEKSDLKKKKKVKIVGGEVVGNQDEMLPLEIIAQLQQQQKKEEAKQKVEEKKETKPEPKAESKKEEKLEPKKEDKAEIKTEAKKEEKHHEEKQHEEKHHEEKAKETLETHEENTQPEVTETHEENIEIPNDIEERKEEIKKEEKRESFNPDEPIIPYVEHEEDEIDI